MPTVLSKTKSHRNRETAAVLIALVMALVTGVLAAIAVATWDKPLIWVPVLAGGAVGILTYTLIAPEH
jgi:hypothetical protein